MSAPKLYIVMSSNDLTEVATKHDKILDHIDKIIKETDKLKMTLSNDYYGRASDAIQESFQTLQKHTELLMNCYEIGKASVEMTRDTLLAMDKEIAEKFGIIIR